jgi:hypothetical protein
MSGAGTKNNKQIFSRTARISWLNQGLVKKCCLKGDGIRKGGNVKFRNLNFILDDGSSSLRDASILTQRIHSQ